MPFLHALVYGAVQGLAEFLPVSSSAHLVLIPVFTGWEDPGLAFDVALHWGTLIAVLIYFRADVVMLVRDTFRFLSGVRTPQTLLPFKIIVATVPGAIIGLLFEKQAETLFRSPALLACALSLMGLGLWAADRIGRKQYGIDEISWPKAFLIGLSQGLAIVPGVSRSGITITTGLLLGLRRDEAVRFSFLMSMPIILGAGLLKSKYLFANSGEMSVWVAMIASFVFGIAAIKVLMTYIRTKSFMPFVIYRLALSAGIILWICTH
jgi:undecaprenyl-diphosphatase